MTLLHECQQVLERTYHPIGVDLEACVIGPQRVSRLIQAAGINPEHFSGRAFTFMRPHQERLHLALYYHPAVISELEEEDPRCSISHRNIESLIDFIEEIIHGAHAALAFRSGVRGSVFHSEPFACSMEIQARVDTYLLIMRYMARLIGAIPDNTTRDWVFKQVICRDSFHGVPDFLARRYRLASRISGMFLRRLRTMSQKERHELIRCFRYESVWGKWKLARGNKV